MPMNVWNSILYIYIVHYSTRGKNMIWWGIPMIQYQSERLVLSGFVCRKLGCFICFSAKSGGSVTSPFLNESNCGVWRVGWKNGRSRFKPTIFGYGSKAFSYRFSWLATKDRLGNSRVVKHDNHHPFPPVVFNTPTLVVTQNERVQEVQYETLVSWGGLCLRLGGIGLLRLRCSSPSMVQKCFKTRTQMYTWTSEKDASWGYLVAHPT